MNDNCFPQTEVDFHFLQNALQNFTHDGAVVSPPSLDWDDSQYGDDSLFMSTSSHDSFSSSATTINTPGINTPENFVGWESTLNGDCTHLGYNGQERESQTRWMNQMNFLELPVHFETHSTHCPSANSVTERTSRNLGSQVLPGIPCDPNRNQHFGHSKTESHGNDFPSISNAAGCLDQHIAISVSRTSKRKSACTSAARTDEQRPVKKTAHNMIEKRYRNKLNDSIAELRDNIPSLRLGGSGMGKEGDPLPKLYKATVITKAVEHISVLEKEISRLMEEVEDLRSKFEAQACSSGSSDEERDKEIGKVIPQSSKL